MHKKDIHLIPSGDRTLVFHPDSFSSFDISEDMKEILEALLSQASQESISQALGVDTTTLEKAAAFFEKHLSNSPTAPVESPDLEAPTLYLNVSNACNLRCVYCYANYGAYASSGKDYMTEHTAFRSVDQFLEAYKEIGRVVFFGGEPLLKSGLISEVTDYISQKNSALGKNKTRYSIITNGILLTDANVDLIHKNGMSVTVSMDGPQTIHDMLRPTVKGENSFTKIDEGIKRLIARGIVPAIESTLTGRHLEAGITPLSLLQFFRNTYGIRNLIISPVASTPGHVTDPKTFYETIVPLYREATQYSLNSLTTNQPISLMQMNQVLRHLIPKRKKRPNQFCNTQLGQERFSISSQGNVYPCQMFNDKEEYNMGSVHDENFANNPSFINVQAQFVNLNKDNMQCKSCWARHMCFTCIAGVEIETKKTKPIPKHRCDLIQGIIEEVIRYMNDLRQDPVRSETFYKNYFGIK